jgi:hypothetical protein
MAATIDEAADSEGSKAFVHITRVVHHLVEVFHGHIVAQDAEGIEHHASVQGKSGHSVGDHVCQAHGRQVMAFDFGSYALFHEQGKHVGLAFEHIIAGADGPERMAGAFHRDSLKDAFRQVIAPSDILARDMGNHQQPRDANRESQSVGEGVARDAIDAFEVIGQDQDMPAQGALCGAFDGPLQSCAGSGPKRFRGVGGGGIRGEKEGLQSQHGFGPGACPGKRVFTIFWQADELEDEMTQGIFRWFGPPRVRFHAADGIPLHSGKRGNISKDRSFSASVWTDEANGFGACGVG